MATSTIDNPHKIIKLDMRLNNVSGSGRLIACGRVATLTMELYGYSPGTNMGLAWIPGAGTSDEYAFLYPIETVWVSCDSYDGSGTRPTGEAQMQSDGILKVSCASTDAHLKISGSWITKG